jgi:hypothetical protein
MDLGAVDGCDAGHPVFETAGGFGSFIGRLVAR